MSGEYPSLPGLTALRIAAVSMLLASIGEWPYGYFQILRLLVTATAAYSAWAAHKLNRTGWAWLLGLVAILFNPVFPVFLDRDTWLILDIITAFVFIASLFQLKPQESTTRETGESVKGPPEESSTESDGRDSDSPGGVTSDVQQALKARLLKKHGHRLRSDSGPGLPTEDEAGARSITELIRKYSIPEEVVQRKYQSYSLALHSSGQDSNWNDDIDQHGRSIGALTEKEIAAARHDLHQAILNRVKVALVSEGWIPQKPRLPG